MVGGVLLSLPASAQVYTRFGPANGILKGNVSTYQTTAAASSDVIGLWTGTCNASTFLKGDGSCATPSGTGVTSVGLTMPTGFSVSGSPVTSSGTLGVTTTLNGVLHGDGSGFTASNVLLGSEVSGTLPVANGGIGVGTLTGIAKGNGTSAFTAAASSDVISLWTGTCNATTFLRADGSCQAPGGGGDALLAGTQTFTGQNTFSRNRTAAGEYAMVFQSAQPSTLFYDNDSAANEKGWRISADSGALLHYAMNDADTSGTIWMQVDRTATAIDSVTFNSPVISTGNTVAGAFSMDSSLPLLRINETAAAANNRQWWLYAQGEQLQGRLSNDAGNSTTQWLAVDRTANTVDSIAFSATAVSASTAFTPDADLGATLGTDSLRFNEVHSINYCEGSCATTRFIDSTGTTARFGNGSAWTAVSIPRSLRVDGASSSFQNTTNVEVGLWKNNEGTDGKAWTIRNTPNFIISTANDSGSAINNALSIGRSGTTVTSIALSANAVTVNGVTVPRTAYAFVQSNGAITGGGITAVGISSVTNGSTGNYTVNFTGSFFSSPPACTASANTGLLGARAQVANANTSTVTVITNDNTGAGSNQAWNIICVGPG